MPQPTLATDTAPPRIQKLLASAREAVDRDMDRRLSIDPDLATGDPARLLVDAMRHAALAPGKRLRPALVVCACESVGGTLARALPAASAVELLHCYTLVHDDLPAMDDDDERRGRPTVHRAFDEATAILAGDGLLTLAFAALADLGALAADAVAVLAQRSGASELLAGQALDLAADGRPPESIESVERIHRGKTGALFAAATEMGAIAGGATSEQRRAFGKLGMAIGIAFQFADDVDDGDFPELAEAAAKRRLHWGRLAHESATSLAGADSVLVDIARWVGGC